MQYSKFRMNLFIIFVSKWQNILDEDKVKSFFPGRALLLSLWGKLFLVADQRPPRGPERSLRGVVPPHPGLLALLPQLQAAQLLLPPLLSVPQLLAVLLHAQPPQVLVALGRKLLGGPGVPQTRSRGVRRAAQAAAGDDVDAVAGQHLAVGVLVAGAGVEARVGRLQALDQQPPPGVEETAILAALTELSGERGDTL